MSELMARDRGAELRRRRSSILAARLQELTTSLGAEVLMSARTAELATDVAALRSLGEVEVRGRAKPVEVFAVDRASMVDGVAVDGASSTPSVAGR
jgi:hypothetical protein